MVPWDSVKRRFYCNTYTPVVNIVENKPGQFDTKLVVLILCELQEIVTFLKRRHGFTSTLINLPGVIAV
jgi:hypothetical protein